VSRNSRSCRQSRRLDSDQVNDLRKFPVGFNHKIRDACTRWRNELRAKSRVCELQVPFLDFWNQVLYVPSKLGDGETLAFVVVLAIHVFRRRPKEQRSPERFGEMQAQ